MLLSDDSEDQLFKKHQDLCTKLNQDLDTLQHAWNSFLDIRTNYTLEGDLVHWMGCAIFIASKKTGQTGARNISEGNTLSLTSLLRHCNLSLTEFLNKISKWVDMTKTTEDIRIKIEKLKRNFSVSYNVFKRYTPIFSEIFQGPVEAELMKQPRNRKQSISRAPPCTPTKVFEFCWVLFATVKSEISLCSEDIVESCHLLQACCDLAFKNAFLDDRRDLLNPTFSELPSNWADPNYIVPREAPCIIDYLCKHNGASTDAKYVKKYTWRNLIKNLFTKNLLQGNAEDFTKLFHPENFEHNLKNITKTYDAHLLNKDELDERIFLGDNVLTDSLHHVGPLSDLLAGTAARSSSSHEYDGILSKQAIRLQALLAGRHSAPSESLIQLFQSCTHDPTERIKKIVEAMSEQFCKAFTAANSNLPIFTQEYTNQKLQLATILFYRFVENIFLQERSQRRDISNLVQQDIFYQSTFACCLEIVIYAFNCQRKFPWILSALKLQPFYFVRVIELIVRLPDQLPREAVKHLNMVEQKIIESLIWKSESSIWNLLKNSGDEFPKFEDIALPGKMMHTVVNEENTTPQKSSSNCLLSPGPSAVDRFQSPISHTFSNDFKKQLFKTAQNVKASQIVIVDKDGIKQFLPVIDKQEPLFQSEHSQTLQPINNKPKKTGSLSIILRKFYNLAYSRMEHLCNLLDITDLKLRQKIFTVFEYSVRKHTDLMRDRHLDQLLMCAVYVVCKVTNAKERKFTEIMQHYRVQPQAVSDVYRNVLIERCTNTTDANDSSENQEPSDTEKRSDLIGFYNTVYIQVMKSFAVQFSTNSNQKADIHLSPLPLVNNSNLVSPRYQVSNNLFISSYDAPSPSLIKGKALEYHFSRSPSKDLEKINSAIGKSIIGKRILGDEGETEPPNKRVNRKFQSLYEERHSHISE